ncbi:MAG: ABC transporter permease [Candidatus Acidiferrales bacterium]
MRTLLQDIQYGFRILKKSPGFAAIAVLTLALGIGGNATVFSWIRAVILDPLPGVERSSQMLAVETLMPSGEYHTSSYPDYRDFRDQNHVFSSLIGFELVGVDMSIRNQSPPERVWGLITTENYFDALGVQPALGRAFHTQPNQALNSDPYIVLGYGLWQRLFGSDRNVVGRTVHINAHPFTVIGVAPPNFFGTIAGVDAQYFVPMMMQPAVLPGEDLEQRAPTFVHIMGRLRPGLTIAQAQAEMTSIAQHLQKEYPNPNTAEGVGVYVAPVWKAHYGVQDFLRSVLAFLMIVALLVLLIACVNVANLLLARATVREKEMAVRSALGAGTGRLVRQLLVESLMLALAGGVGGIVLALWGVNLLTAFLPPAHLPIALGVNVDGSVLAFTLILSLVTGLVFGLAPAWQISRANLNESLKTSARTASAGGGDYRLRDILVVSEMVIATVLLVAAGLLLRSLHKAEAMGPGYNTENVTLAAFDLRGSGYTDVRAVEFYDHLLAQLRANPAVESASMERFVPLWFTGRGYSTAQIENYTPQPNEDMGIDFNVVGPDYFHVLQIPLISGRDFSEQDRDGAPKVVIVNQTMANRFWPGQDATGRRVQIWGNWRTVVGVVRDIKYHRMNEPPRSFIYLPQLLGEGTDTNILVRSQLPKAAVIGAVRSAAKSLDSKVQPLETDSLDGLLKASMFANRTAASLASVLGILGTLLAALGIYGVLSYSVSQRIREIGIRVALGAQRRHVLELVVGHGLRLALFGVAVGALAAAAVTSGMGSLLYGISATDPLTFAIVMLLVAIVAALAAYIPARRAMRVDPMVALRHE